MSTTAAPLTDGMSSLADSDERLTTAACWRVQTEQWSHQPIVVVPFNTSLDQVEAVGRRAPVEFFNRHEGITPEEYERNSTQVATARIKCVERLDDIQLDPRFG